MATIKNLRGNKLPDQAKLSDYLDNLNQPVRLTNLRAGQVLEVDVSLDGEVGGKYIYPEGVAEWKGPTGLEAVHIGLLAIIGGEGFDLVFKEKAEIRHSRGRGINVARVRNCQIYDAWVRGARAAGIAFEDCHGVQLHRPVTIDTSNYQETRTDVEENNVAGSIKFRRCSNYKIYDGITIDHVGNGITATESSNGEWINPTTVEVYGAHQYVNASPGHTVSGGIALGSKTHRPNAYVINSEKEHDGASEGAVFTECFAFDVKQGFGIWGNEEKIVPLQRVVVQNGRFVGDTTGPKLHKRSPVANFDQTGTRYLATAKIDSIALGAIRNLRETFLTLVRSHADWEEIVAERETIRFSIKTLSEVAPEPEEPAIDQAALRAWVKEAEDLPKQIADWLTKGKALIG